MFGAERNGIAQAKVVAFQNARLSRATFALVGEDDDRRRQAAQPVGNFRIQRGDPSARVDHEQRDIGMACRRLGLHPHPAGESLFILIFKAGRINDAEFETDQIGIAFAPVTRNAGPVIDQRDALANQPVEQC